jgi:hypothetical protein
MNQVRGFDHARKILAGLSEQVLRSRRLPTPLVELGFVELI